MNDTELLRTLFYRYSAEHCPPDLVQVGMIGDLSLYAAHLRVLLKLMLRCEQVIELLNDVPELRRILSCLIGIEKARGFPDDMQLRDPSPPQSG